MDYYECFISEFIESNNCYDETSAQAIRPMLNYEKLFDVVTSNSKFELDDILSLDHVDLEVYVKKNIDSVLHGIYKKNESEGVSSLGYITSLVIENIPQDQKALFTEHSSRKLGELYESTMATILYAGSSELEITSEDFFIIKLIASIVILDFVETMRSWVRSDSSDLGKYKEISKFLLSEPSINKKYILDLVALIGIENLFDRVQNVGDIKSKDLIDHYSISRTKVSKLSIENKEDVLFVINSADANKTGAFLSLSRSECIPESTFTHPGLSREIQTAKIFKRSSDKDIEFWSAIGLSAIRIMLIKFNNFRASNTTSVPAPASSEAI